MIEDVGKLILTDKIERTLRRATDDNQNFNYNVYHPLNEVGFDNRNTNSHIK